MILHALIYCPLLFGKRPSKLYRTGIRSPYRKRPLLYKSMCLRSLIKTVLFGCFCLAKPVRSENPDTRASGKPLNTGASRTGAETEVTTERGAENASNLESPKAFVQNLLPLKAINRVGNSLLKFKSRTTDGVSPRIAEESSTPLEIQTSAVSDGAIRHVARRGTQMVFKGHKAFGNCYDDRGHFTVDQSSASHDWSSEDTSDTVSDVIRIRTESDISVVELREILALLAEKLNKAEMQGLEKRNKAKWMERNRAKNARARKRWSTSRWVMTGEKA